MILRTCLENNCLLSGSGSGRSSLSAPPKPPRIRVTDVTVPASLKLRRDRSADPCKHDFDTRVSQQVEFGHKEHKER